MSCKTIDRSFKTAPVAVIPVNPYFWSKSTEQSVTDVTHGRAIMSWALIF